MIFQSIFCENFAKNNFIAPISEQNYLSFFIAAKGGKGAFFFFFFFFCLLRSQIFGLTSATLSTSFLRF